MSLNIGMSTRMNMSVGINLNSQVKKPAGFMEPQR